MIKLDKAVLDESVGALKKGFNEEVLNQMQQVASMINSMEDGSSVVQQAKENLAKMQKAYNTVLPQTEVFLAEIGKTYDIAEYMESKANIGDVRNVSGAEVKSRINPETVMI